MRNMRRSDRAIEKEEAFQILENGEYGVLSTVGSDNQPYGFPVSFCVLITISIFTALLKAIKSTTLLTIRKYHFVLSETRVCYLPNSVPSTKAQ